MCRFTFDDLEEFYQTKAVLHENIIKCLSPRLNKTILAVYNGILSIDYLKMNLTFGYYHLKFVNCSNFLSCSSCTSFSNFCLWNRKTIKCFPQSKVKISSINHLISSNQCPSMYLQSSKIHLAYYIDTTLIIHIEQCNPSMNIHSCQLNDHRKRLSLIALNPLLTPLINSCLLKCFFQWLNSSQITFYRPLNLQLSIEYFNQTVSIIPNTQISLYQCEHLALNCSSCLQLNPSYGCTWCNNQCILKTHSIKCLNNHQCLSPIIEKIDPLILPINGGTLVTIKGKYFDLFQLTIKIADIPCQLIEEESTSNK